MGPIRSPETSVLNQPSMRKIPEDEKIQVNSNGSLPSRIPPVLHIHSFVYHGLNFFFSGATAQRGPGLPILEFSRSHTVTHQSE